MLSLEEKYQILEKLTTKISMKETLDYFFSQISRLTSIEGKALFFLHNEKLKIYKTEFPDSLKGFEKIYDKNEVKLDKNFTIKECLEKNKYLLLKQENLKSYDIFTRQKFELWKIKEAIYFPFSSKGEKPAGLLILFSTEKPIENELRVVLTVQEILDIFFYTILIALEKQKIKETQKETEEIKEKYKKLVYLSSHLNTLLQAEKFYDILLYELLNLFKFDMGFVQIEQEGRLVTFSGVAINPTMQKLLERQIEYFGKKENAPLIYSENGPESAASDAFINQTHYYIPDITSVQDLPMRKKDKIALEMTDNLLKSLLIIPIKEQEKTIGIIQFWNLNENANISDIDIEVILIVCSFVPSILKNVELYSVLDKQNKQIKQELILAKKIQTHLLPSQFPKIPNTEFAAIYKPMEEIGGDLYDFIRLREQDKIGIFISDISGHGVPAALITSMVKVMLETSGGRKLQPPQILSYINNNLLDKTNDHYLTAFYGVYHSTERRLQYSRAGHPYPIVLRKDRSPFYLEGKGNILGIFDNLMLEEKEVFLEKGDKVIFYTDGLVDAPDKNRIKFGKKMLDILEKNKHLAIQELLKTLYEALVNHTGKENFGDDVCIVGMEIF